MRELLSLIVSKAEDEKKAIYLVGGLPRDLILGRPILDLDLVLESNAINFGKKLAAEYGGELKKHNRFGTAKWFIKDLQPALLRKASGTGKRALTAQHLPEHVDLITARSETYPQPAVLPEVAFSDITDDLYRRDFCINAVAIRLDGKHRGEILDPFGGLPDIQSGTIKVLHDRSFIDDPTRAFRAVRFEQRLDFTIDSNTQRLMKEALPYIHLLSGSRIRHEFDLIMAEKSMTAIMDRLQALNLIFSIHPSLSWNEMHLRRWRQVQNALPDITVFQNGESMDDLQHILGYTNWFLPLAEPRVVELCAKFKLPSKIKAAILAAKQLYDISPRLAAMAPSKAAFTLDNYAGAALFYVFATLEDEEAKSVIYRYVTDWRDKKPLTTGGTLQALGVAPGPVYRQILTALREAWIDGDIASEAEEIEIRDQLIHESSR